MDTVFLALRVIVALGAVFGALLFAHRWITKGRPGAAPRNRQISIVARQGLGAKAGIAVVDAGGRRYLLGVTEHAVTVLDTLGAAEATTGEPSLVASQPIAVARFEQELRTVTIATADVPIVVHGAADPRDPSGPVTQTISITPGHHVVSAATASFRLDAAGHRRPAAGPPAYTSRRAARAAEQQAAEHLASSMQPSSGQPTSGQPTSGQQRPPAQGPLAGSVLSPGTWKQTFDALKKLR